VKSQAANPVSGKSERTNDPPNVIFDTDIWSDIDDALALAMLHALHDRHEINLAAVTISTREKSSATYVDLVNTFYGHPGIPIGLVRDELMQRHSGRRRTARSPLHRLPTHRFFRNEEHPLGQRFTPGNWPTAVR